MDTQFSATQEYRTIVRPPSFGISVRGGAAMSRNAPASGVCAVLYMGSFVRVDQRISAEAAMAVQLRPKLRPQLSATNRVCLSVPLSRRQDQDLSFLLTGCSIIFRDSKKFMNTSPWQDFLATPILFGGDNVWVFRPQSKEAPPSSNRNSWAHVLMVVGP